MTGTALTPQQPLSEPDSGYYTDEFGNRLPQLHGRWLRFCNGELERRYREKRGQLRFAPALLATLGAMAIAASASGGLAAVAAFVLLAGVLISFEAPSWTGFAGLCGFVGFAWLWQRPELGLWFPGVAGLASVAVFYKLFDIELDDRCRWWIDEQLADLSPDQWKDYRAAVSSTDEPDRALLGGLEDVRFAPVFVSGYARSGTTFLFDALASVLHLPALTFSDIVLYDQLLTSHRDGSLAGKRAALDILLDRCQQRTRLIDRMPAASNAKEEHNILFLRQGRDLVGMGIDADALSEVCRKLVVTQAEASDGTVLLKSPSDYGRERQILEVLPGARFIHLKRDVQAVRDSATRVFSLMFGERRLINPYGYLLFGSHPAFAILHFARSIFGERICMVGSKLTLELSLKGKPAAVLDALRVTDPEKVHEMDYADLVADPQKSLLAIAEFLGLEADPDALAAIVAVEPPRARESTAPH